MYINIHIERERSSYICICIYIWCGIQASVIEFISALLPRLLLSSSGAILYLYALYHI